MRGKLESDITLIEFLQQFGKIIDTFEGTIYSVEHKFHLISYHLEMMDPEDVDEWKRKVDRIWYPKITTNKKLLPSTCEKLEVPYDIKDFWNENKPKKMKTIQTHLEPEAFELIKELINFYMNTQVSMKGNIENEYKGNPDKEWIGFQNGNNQFYFEKIKRFIQGQWYTHTEPGQEKFLIRVEDPEKQICSGWDCKGKPFKNHWVYLGSRLTAFKANKDQIESLNTVLENELNR